MKIIRTNLFSDAAFHIINGITIYLIQSNRIGKSERCGVISKTKRDFNNEVIIEIDNDDVWTYERSMYHKFDGINKSFTSQVLNFYADTLKNRIMRGYFAWKHDNICRVPIYTSYCSNDTKKFAVKDLCYICNFLKHKKNLDHRYPADIIRKINGEEFNPILTEQNRMIQEELAKLEKERADALIESEKKYDVEFELLAKALEKKQQERDNKINAEFQQKKDEIMKSLKEFKSLAA